MAGLWKRHRMKRLIRAAIDTYPDGICFAYPNGTTILANATINRVCLALTGQTILNAERTWHCLNGDKPPSSGARAKMDIPLESGEALPIFELDDGTVWQFRRTALQIDGAAMYQYTAEDVTQIYRYGQKLSEMNRQTSAYHERQRALIKDIAKTNDEKERLHIKMQIHDDFGHCLIATRNYLEAGERGLVLGSQEAVELCDEWERAVDNMSDLNSVKRESASSSEAEIMRVADLIGCKIVFDGELPEERHSRMLLMAAIREALTNAVRHAGANRLIVRIKSDQENYHVEISDNGHCAVTSIREGVGLGALRTRLEKSMARMDIECRDGVRLLLTLPREG